MRTSQSPRPQRSGFTLIEVFFVLAVLVVVTALLLPATRRAREPARRTQCKNNLKQIGLALHNYHDTFGVFPPAYTVDSEGKPLHSWRTLILPWIDQPALYRKIDFSKPWDDPVNAEVFKTIPSVYRCPTDGFSASGHTTYLAIVTPNGCMHPRQPRSLKEITDGASNTIMVMEVSHAEAVPWMAPRDADEQILSAFGPQSKETHAGGRHALFCDGTIRFLSQNINQTTLQALCTTTGGETIGDF